MSECIFCKVVSGEIPADIIYEDDNMIVFNDIDPRAPIHLLIAPKKHIASLDELDIADGALIGDIFVKIKDIANQVGLENGYRLVFEE